MVDFDLIWKNYRPREPLEEILLQGVSKDRELDRIDDKYVQ